MVVLERCFHVVTVDCERALVVTEVETFLARVTTGLSSTTSAREG
jgi:hypothetical protein